MRGDPSQLLPQVILDWFAQFSDDELDVPRPFYDDGSDSERFTFALREQGGRLTCWGEPDEEEHVPLASLEPSEVARALWAWNLQAGLQRRSDRATITPLELARRLQDAVLREGAPRTGADLAARLREEMEELRLSVESGDEWAIRLEAADVAYYAEGLVGWNLVREANAAIRATGLVLEEARLLAALKYVHRALHGKDEAKEREIALLLWRTL